MVFNIRQPKKMQQEEQGMRRHTKIFAVVSLLGVLIVGYYLYSYSRENTRLTTRNVSLNINLRKYAAGYTKCMKNLETSKQDAMNFHDANKVLQAKTIKQEEEIKDSNKNNADVSMKLDYAYQFFLDVKDMITGDQSIAIDKLVLPETSKGLLEQIEVFKTEHNELEKLRATHDETTQALNTLRTTHADLSATSGGLENRVRKLMTNNRLLKKQLKNKKDKVEQKSRVIDALEQTIQSLEEDIKNLKETPGAVQLTPEPVHETKSEAHAPAASSQESQSQSPAETQTNAETKPQGKVKKSPQESVEKSPQESVDKSPQENVEKSPDATIKQDVEEVIKKEDSEKAPATIPEIPSKDPVSVPEIPSKEQVEKELEAAKVVSDPILETKSKDTSDKRILESLVLTPEQMLAKSLQTANVVQTPVDSLKKKSDELPADASLPKNVEQSSQVSNPVEDTPSERRISEDLGAVSETINAPSNPSNSLADVPNSFHEQIKSLDSLAADVAEKKGLDSLPSNIAEKGDIHIDDPMSDDEADEDEGVDADADPLMQ